jgi:hypothetical protein
LFVVTAPDRGVCRKTMSLLTMSVKFIKHMCCDSQNQVPVILVLCVQHIQMVGNAKYDSPIDVFSSDCFCLPIFHDCNASL